jgi:hypothetical protein
MTVKEYEELIEKIEKLKEGKEPSNYNLFVGLLPLIKKELNNKLKTK